MTLINILNRCSIFLLSSLFIKENPRIKDRIKNISGVTFVTESIIIPSSGLRAGALNTTE